MEEHVTHRTCALCHADAELRYSHIIPELIYKPMYDAKHRFMQISLRERHMTHQQKGLREYLLCQDCENYLSKSENYVRRFLYGGTGFHVKQEGPFIILSGFNYRAVRIFFLSLLWRMSVSALPVFNAVSLGPHEEQIRQMLIADNPGEPYQYGFFAVVPQFQGKVFDDWILEPEWVRWNHYGLYRVVIGGILYIFIISQSSTSIT